MISQYNTAVAEAPPNPANGAIRPTQDSPVTQFREGLKDFQLVLQQMRKIVDEQEGADVSCLLREIKKAQDIEIRALQTEAVQRLVIDPMLRTVCGAINTVRRARSSVTIGRYAPGQTPSAKVAALNAFGTIESMLQEELFSHGIEEVVANIGDPYDAKNHERIQAETRPTVDPDLNGCVAETRTAGFRRGNVLLIRPAVVLFKLQEKLVHAQKCDCK